MKSIIHVYFAVLFFVLSPNILFRFPLNSNKYIVALVHSLIFTFVLYLTNDFVNNLVNKESFKEGALGWAVEQGVKRYRRR